MAALVGIGTGCNALLGMDERAPSPPGEGASGATGGTSSSGAGGSTTTSSGGTTADGGEGGGFPCHPDGLEDTFDGTEISFLWDPWQDGSSTVGVVGDRLRLTAIDATGYASVKTAFTYDVTDCAMWVQAPLVFPTQAPGEVEMRLADAHDFDSALSISAYSGALHARLLVQGDTTPLAGVPYSSAEHRHWRIREQAGTTYFETSADGGSWAALTETATPAWITDATLTLMAGLWDVSEQTVTAEFDSVNVVP